MLQYLTIGLLLVSTARAQEIQSGVQNAPQLYNDGYYPTEKTKFDMFDWQLVQDLSGKHSNVLISPVSLKLVLALLYEGSGGETAKEFQSVLGFQNKDESKDYFNKTLALIQNTRGQDYVLNFGSRLFLDNQMTPQPKFKAIAYDTYKTEIEPTNFEDALNASATINTWISKLTHGKVTEIVKPDDLTKAVMVATNAIYFKGNWVHQFPKNETRKGKFNLLSFTKVEVEYMSTIGDFYYHEHTELDATFLRLPYKGNKYSLWIVLPNAKTGLTDLLKNINTMYIDNALYFVDKKTVHVTIPKFHFNFQENYVRLLRKIGLRQMFQNTASFPGIVRGNSNVLRLLQVSDVIQKTGIELDEEGSTVFAASGVNIGNKFGEPQYYFNASHPFLFFVLEETGSNILFMGKVENPLESDVKPSPPQQEQESAPEPQISTNFQLLQPNGAEAFLQPTPQLDPIPLSPQNSPQDINLNDGRLNFFDIALLKEVANSPGNVLISPLSIKTTLAMVLEGAKGVCADEIQQALRIGNIDQARYYLKTILSKLKETRYLDSSNAVFVSNKVKVYPEYQQKLLDYKAGVTQVDFTNVPLAVRTINQWVRDVTRGAITEIISAENIYKDFAVVIANALYFKGKWKTSFDEKSTRLDNFYVPGKGEFPVQMMQVNNFYNYKFLHDLNAEAIDIPYENEYSMLIVMPGKENNIHNLATDMHKLSDILDDLNRTELNLNMPKFEIEYTKNLIDVLKPLHVTTIFSPQANLSGIVEQDNVRVNNIIHKTKIEVDEQGTKAAAATGVFVIPLMGSTARKVTINRPFLYFIYHVSTRTIIFEGIFREPQIVGRQQPVQPQPRPLTQQQPQQILTSRGNFNYY